MRVQLYRGHANATTLFSSPLVGAQGSESDDPGSSPGRGKALFRWDVREKKMRAPLWGLAKSIYYFSVSVWYVVTVENLQQRKQFRVNKVSCRQRLFQSASVFFSVATKNPCVVDLLERLLRTTAHPKLQKILPHGANSFQRNAASVSAPESAEWFTFQRNRYES